MMQNYIVHSSDSTTMTDSKVPSRISNTSVSPPHRQNPRSRESQQVQALEQMFTNPCVEQTHAGLPFAVAKALSLPEVLDLIAQHMGDSAIRDRNVKLTLRAMVRTCQSWHATFIPQLYRTCKFKSLLWCKKLFTGLDRYGYMVEQVTIQTTNVQVALTALAKIHASCVVREYLSGRLEWPGLEAEIDKASEDDKNEADAKDPSFIVRTKSDLDRMMTKELLAYVENHPLQDLKVGRVQHVNIKKMSFAYSSLNSAKLNVLLRSFSLKSITCYPVDGTYERGGMTSLLWWSHHFSTLESITLQDSEYETPWSLLQAVFRRPSLRSITIANNLKGAYTSHTEEATQEQFEALVRQAPEASNSQGRDWHHPNIKSLCLSYKFFLPLGGQSSAPHVILPDGVTKVSLGVYYIFKHVGASLEHLTLTNVGGGGGGGGGVGGGVGEGADVSATPSGHQTTNDCVFLASQVPKLRSLDLTVDLIEYSGIWATIVEAFQRHCPQLESLVFNGQLRLQKPPEYSYGALEDLSTSATALIDVDLRALAGYCMQDPFTGHVLEEQEEEEQEDKGEKRMDDQQILRDGDKNTLVTQFASKIGLANSRRPLASPRPGWGAVLCRLKLRQCRYIKAEGLLAILENCSRLEALDVRETWVGATMKLFEQTATRWACADSLVALGLDLGLDVPRSVHHYSQDSPAWLQQQLARQEATAREVQAWHGQDSSTAMTMAMALSTRFSTVELLRIRGRLFTLRRLRVLYLGGPLMEHKIVARLADLRASRVEGGSEDADVQRALAGIEERGGAEVGSLLEQIPFLEVHVSLAHVTTNTTRHWERLSQWCEELKGGEIFGTPDCRGETPVFTLLRQSMGASLARLLAAHRSVVHFMELARFVTE